MWKERWEKVLRENTWGQGTLALGQGPCKACAPPWAGLCQPCLTDPVPASLQTWPVTADLCGQPWKLMPSYPQDTQNW